MARPFPDLTKLPHCPSGMGKHPVINTWLMGTAPHHKHHLLLALIVLLVTAPCTVTNDSGLMEISFPCHS